MSIMTAVADAFRSTTNKTNDHFGVLPPLLATSEYVTTAKDLLATLSNPAYTDVLSGKTRPSNKYVARAVEAYRTYTKSLTSHEQNEERNAPLSTLVRATDAVANNIASVEDNFRTLFGQNKGELDHSTARSSALFIIGYLERAENFTTWLANFAEHLTAENDDSVPPFRTKELANKAVATADFAEYNLGRTNGRSTDLIQEVRTMQSQGSDVAVRAASGEWIDELVHDDQLSDNQQQMISASLRSIGMIGFTHGAVRFKDRMDLLNSRKDWLTSKILFEQSKMRGMDPDSSEYKKIKNSVDHYAALVSRYEQRLERMRA